MSFEGELQRIKDDIIKNLPPEIKVQKIGNIPIFSENDEDKNCGYLKIKQGIDLLASILLLLLLWPLFIACALAIKMDSKGPVFFKQDRIGKDGKVFKIYKFRTMVHDAEPYEINPLDHSDYRITSFGRFLRKTSLDEMPQLVNVLKGEMSLVGPRPELPWLVQRYLPWQRKRFAVPQGMTGWWQVNGRSARGEHQLRKMSRPSARR